MTIVAFKPLEEPEPYSSYVTRDGMWAAIPYGQSKYVIIHNGEQVHTSNNLQTAKNFIAKQQRKIKK